MDFPAIAQRTTPPAPAQQARALPGPAAPGPAPAQTPAGILARLQSRGVHLCLRRGRLAVQPPQAYAALSDADRAALRAHRRELKELVRNDVPPEALPAPRLRVSTGERSDDARACLAPKGISPDEYDAFGLFKIRGVVSHAMGDEFAQRILRGEIPRAEAIEIEQARRRECLSLTRRPRP